jgi:hypothetical protein
MEKGGVWVEKEEEKKFAVSKKGRRIPIRSSNSTQIVSKTSTPFSFYLAFYSLHNK